MRLKGDNNREIEAERKQELARYRDPTFLAESFLATDPYVHVDGEMLGRHTTHRTLRKWQAGYYFWKNGCYRHIQDDTVRANIAAWLQDGQLAMRVRFGGGLRITRSLVSDVMLNIDPMILIRESTELNAWLDDKEHPRVIAMKNGLLALDGVEAGGEPVLMEHTPAYFSLTCLPYPYDPAATCPGWLAFLEDVLEGNEQYIGLLQMWCGYLFTTDLRYQKCLLIVGPGANGKGVCVFVIQALVGRENCSQVGLAQFGRPFSLHAMYGKVLNVTNESSHLIEEEGENVLKSLVAGDRFTFEQKYKEPIHGIPTAKIMLATNSLPRFSDKTQGIWRRILLLPFDKTIEEDRQIRTLAEDLTEHELPGIFVWALEGLRKLTRARRFIVPQGSRELLEAHRRDSDPCRAFLLDQYIYLASAPGVERQTLYDEYKAYCERSNYRPLGVRQFGRQVHYLFPNVQDARPGTGDERARVYQGLVRRTSSEEGLTDA